MRRPAFFGVVLGVLLATGGVRGDDPPKKADRTAGLEEVYKHFRASQDGAGEDATKAREKFREALQKLAPQLPSVTPEKEAPKTYTKVPLNSAKKSFDAFRFKAPDGKTNWDMSWEFVVPTGAIRSWYILPAEGTMEGFRTFQPTKDYEEKGVDLPKENLRVVQPLTGGHLKPGKEYIIWFEFEKNEPADFHIRIGLTEPKSD